LSAQTAQERVLPLKLSTMEIGNKSVGSPAMILAASLQAADTAQRLHLLPSLHTRSHQHCCCYCRCRSPDYQQHWKLLQREQQQQSLQVLHQLAAAAPALAGRL
jgi:hypothetical protein